MTRFSLIAVETDNGYLCIDEDSWHLLNAHTKADGDKSFEQRFVKELRQKIKPNGEDVSRKTKKGLAQIEGYDGITVIPKDEDKFTKLTVFEEDLQ